LALYAWQKRHPYSRVTRLFWVTNSVCLAVATLSDGHRNITTPLLTLSRLEHAQAAVVGMASPPQFYAGKTPLLPVEDLSALHHLLKIREDVQLTHILLMQLPKDEDYKTLKQLPRHTCSAMHIYTGDFVDQWLVRLNKRNQGRAPTALLQCSFQTYSQPKSASSSTIKG
jgi:hypothetical protein